MFKSSVVLHKGMKNFLACMTERGMTKIVRQCHSMGQFFINPQILSQAPGNLRHF
jgi:hypothetical protein